MIRSLSLVCASFIFAFGAVSAVASVELSSLRARPVASELGGGDWIEIEAELTVRSDAADPDRRDPRFLDGVSVVLAIAYEVNRGNGGRGFEFFDAEALPVALVEGRNLLRFYLPPEIVARDRPSGDPHSYLLEVRRGPEVVLSSPSRSLLEPQAMTSFVARTRSDGERNRGVLVPQNLSPFHYYYPEATPTFRVLTGRF